MDKYIYCLEPEHLINEYYSVNLMCGPTKWHIVDSIQIQTGLWETAGKASSETEENILNTLRILTQEMCSRRGLKCDCSSDFDTWRIIDED